MHEEFIIKGLDETKYPDLGVTIRKLMSDYQIKKIRVFISPKFDNVAALSLFGNYLFIGQPIIEKLCKDEMEGVLSHEFSHLFNRDSISSLIISLIFTLPLIYFYFQINPQNPNLFLYIAT